MRSGAVERPLGRWRPVLARRLTVGLAVAADRVRAVGVVGSTIRWIAEAERKMDEPLVASLRALLEACPLPRWPRPRAVVAVGPAAVQVKQLSRLPPLSDPGALADLVREGVSRFFITDGVPLVTTAVRLTAPGSGWAAAFEAPVATDVERACRAARLRLTMIVPTVVALAHALEPPGGSWADGSVRVELLLDGHSLVGVRRLRGSEPSPPSPSSSPRATPVAALRVLGERALAFADAYGAAQVVPPEPLALRPRGGRRDPSAHRAHVALAAAALTLASVIGLVGPSLYALHIAHRAEARLATMRARAEAALRAGRALAQVTDALGQVSAFARARRSVTLLLRDLTRALPEGAALLELELDTAQVTMVVLAPQVSEVMRAMEQVSAVTAPEIVGPVTREVVGARELERATVRARLALPWSGAGRGGHR